MKGLKSPVLIIIMVTILILAGWGWVRFFQSQQKSDQVASLEKQIQELEELLIDQASDNGGKSPSPEEDKKPLQVTTSRARVPEKDETLSYDGAIEPSATTYIFPPIPGEVEQVLVEEGDPVDRGDLLLKMDSREIEKNIEQAQAGVDAARAQLEMAEEGPRQEELDQLQKTVEQAETQLEMARDSYERMQKLREEDIITEQEYEQARSEKNLARTNLTSARINLDMARSGARDLEIEAARAQLSQAETQLEMAEMAREDARVTAPRDGVIIQRTVEPGEMVGEAQPPLVLGELDPLHLTIQVGEQDIGLVSGGQRAEIEINALPGEEITGEVIQVAPVADPDSGLFPVTIKIPGTDNRIRPGMYAEARIIIDPGPGYPLLDQEAVHYENDSPYVYLIRDNQATPQMVELGEDHNGKVEITSGLEPGAQVITQARGELTSGREVEIMEGD